MHLLHVVGARPNFMKAAPLLRALEAAGVQQTLVHSGQHYDRNMSEVFFEELGIREPDVNLHVGAGSHAQQTAAIMSRFEPVLLEKKPDAVIVYGDVNSTAAVAMVCAKLQVEIVHMEAGLRSFDRTMPEEINRLITDQLASLLLTPSQDGNDNLLHEGVDPARIHLVGNIMIDSLIRDLPKADDRFARLLAEHRLNRFGLITLHRPSNVDSANSLQPLLQALKTLAADLQFVFPVHPRTRKQIAEYDLPEDRILLLEPQPYLDFLALQKHAKIVITDSGGVQEETTYLGVPCLTVRKNTERPVTVSIGTNVLIGLDMNKLIFETRKVLDGRAKHGAIPPFWDGHTAERATALLTGRAVPSLVASR